MVSAQQEGCCPEGASVQIHSLVIEGPKGSSVQSCVSFSEQPRILYFIYLASHGPASWRTGEFLHCCVPIAGVKTCYSMNG